MDAHGKFTDVNHLVKDLIEEVHEEHEEEIAVMPSKEHEPIVHHEAAHLEQALEHEPSQEVAPFVETRKEIPEIPLDVEKQGVTTTPTTNFPSFQEVKLPLSDEKVAAGLKEPVTSSWRWLSEFCMFLLHRVNQTIKDVHGKITRVAIAK